MQNQECHFQPRAAARWLATSAAVLAAGYGAYAGLCWYRFGRAKNAHRDRLLDRFMPDYDVLERHQIRVAAPAETTMAVAKDIEIAKSPIIRWIFKARETMMGSLLQPETLETSLIDQMTSMGWRILAQKPGREIVMGAVTQPWVADVVFRPLEPDEFASFQEPGYVKIAWTLRSDPLGSGQSIFSTETRAKATDPIARKRFRRYWSLVSAGVVLIRWASLRLTKREAERLARRTKQAA